MGQLENSKESGQKSVRFGFLNYKSGAKNVKFESLNVPFRAPVYRSYWEAINGLYKQNLAGFYKGNGVRSFHILLFHRMNTDLTFWTESAFPNQIKAIKKIPCL